MIVPVIWHHELMLESKPAIKPAININDIENVGNKVTTILSFNSYFKILGWIIVLIDISKMKIITIEIVIYEIHLASYPWFEKRRLKQLPSPPIPRARPVNAIGKCWVRCFKFLILNKYITLFNIKLIRYNYFKKRG